MIIIWRLSIRCVESERERAFHENQCPQEAQKSVPQISPKYHQKSCKNSQCMVLKKAHNRVVTNFHERAVTKPASSESENADRGCAH